MYLRILKLFLISYCLICSSLSADNLNKTKASLSFDSNYLVLNNGSELRLNGYDSNRESEKISSIIAFHHNVLTRVFGFLPKIKININILNRKNYFLKTNAPYWSNALYFDDSIFIPRPENGRFEEKNYRVIKHEYTHAVIHELSGENCPGWLDEGLAQYLEGEEHPKIKILLKSWLRNNHPISLKNLETGFTGFDQELVPIAYSQSYIVTKFLIDQFGINNLKKYLKDIKNTKDYKQSFVNVYKIKFEIFEKRSKKFLRSF